MIRFKNKHILVTRPAHQAENLCQLIAQRGGIAVLFPCIEIVATTNNYETTNCLANLNRYQWLIFISVNAVNFALKANGGKITIGDTHKIAAIGQATAQALSNAGLTPALCPISGNSSEALLATLKSDLQPGQRCLIIRGQGGREELAIGIQKQNVKVDYLEVYRRVRPNVDNSIVIELLANQGLDAITITSNEILQNLMALIDKQYHKQLFNIPVVLVSQRIQTLAQQMGFKRTQVAASPSDSAIVDTVIKLIKEE